ncbi:hypothetical protein B0H63DRAFT_520086 [Podospora didyma]|uniref:Uncharacterized protein n=1 Tax=Podospora didyma TaxID=330526 RepID=A0AAE0U4M8_9PEZI|nr:hypothetical protein B0H63DRAFT_520086 [Podospora didyma]
MSQNSTLEEGDVDFAEWDIAMPLIGDAGDDAGFRMKNLKNETERPMITGYDRSPHDTIVLGRLYHVVNGYMHGADSEPATLIVFEWMFRKGKLGRRFREAHINVTFAAHGLRQGMFPGDEIDFYDPDVVKVNPTVPRESDPVTYTVDKKTGFKLGASLGYNGIASVDPEMSKETAESGITRIDYRVQQGFPLYVKRESGPMDGAHWSFFENVKAESGLPHLVRTAVLLQRRDYDETGPFAATFTTVTSVSVWEDAKEKFKRAVGMVPRDEPVHIDPSPRKGVTHGATVLFGSRAVAHRVSTFDRLNLDDVDLDQAVAIEEKKEDTKKAGAAAAALDKK